MKVTSWPSAFRVATGRFATAAAQVTWVPFRGGRCTRSSRSESGAAAARHLRAAWREVGKDVRNEMSLVEATLPEAGSHRA